MLNTFKAFVSACFWPQSLIQGRPVETSPLENEKKTRARPPTSPFLGFGPLPDGLYSLRNVIFKSSLRGLVIRHVLGDTGGGRPRIEGPPVNPEL